MSVNKENDMVCNGAPMPQVAYAMEMYNSYINGIYHMWRAYSALTGVTYWADQLHQSLNKQKQGE